MVIPWLCLCQGHSVTACFRVRKDSNVTNPLLYLLEGLERLVHYCACFGVRQDFSPLLCSFQVRQDFSPLLCSFQVWQDFSPLLCSFQVWQNISPLLCSFQVRKDFSPLSCLFQGQERLQSIIVFISGQERLQSIILLVSGSGKTLAYLLPALNMLMQRRESTALVEESVNTPSIIILTPTRELADQVMVSITGLLTSTW